MPERWPQVERIYSAVVARPESEWATLLTELCAGDDSLRNEVESLLAHEDAAGTFLETPAFAEADVAGHLAGERTLVGRRFGPYIILAPIGSGGMGDVYRARDERLGRQVAIKLLPPHSASDPDRRARLEREARTLAALNHPHIGAIYGVEDVDGCPALVLELVEGETLAEHVARGPVPLAQALPIARQIADALAAAHERGIIHRDLKPANIKISPDGVVKVLDFGIATFARSPEGAGAHAVPGKPHRGKTLDTQTGLIFGTPAYMSPERAAGRTADTRSDLWAFGVVLLEMLTGRPVFTAHTGLEVLESVLKAEPDVTGLPNETPAPIRKLLHRCLQKDRTRRLDSVTAARLEIDDALATLAAGSSAEERSRARRWNVSRRSAAVYALLAAAVLTGGVLRLWQQDFFWRNPLEGATVERLTDFEGDEFDASISPDGKVMAFLSDRDGPLDAWVSQIGSGVFVNLTNGRFQLTANRVTRQTGFSGDGGSVWFLQQVPRQPVSWTSWLVPAFSGAPRPFVENGLNPVWSPDGQSVVYHSSEPGDPIYIADRSGNSPKRLYQAQPGIHNHHPIWSPDGRSIYFVSGTPQTEDMDIWRIPVSTTEAAMMPERITFHRALVAYPAWLDARTLIYTATAEDGAGQWLYALDVDHRIPHRVDSGVAEEYLSVAVSESRPRRIVATLATPTASLWTIPLSHTVQTEQAVSRVRAPNSRARGPRFGPGYLAYLSSKGGGNGLWKRENDVDQELWRGDGGGVVAPPAISPDGQLICFSYRKQGTTRLYVMNANGTNVRTLFDSLDVRGPASWSADRKWVVVAANRGEGTRLFKIPVDGGQPVRLLDTLAEQPVWSPDGSFILYTELLAAGGNEIKAITKDGLPVPIPFTRVGAGILTSYRFLPQGEAIIGLEGALGSSQNFFRIDLQSGEQRRLTDLAGRFTIQHFDVSPDGKHIVFDRVQLNADIVVRNLAR